MSSSSSRAVSKQSSISLFSMVCAVTAVGIATYVVIGHKKRKEKQRQKQRRKQQANAVLAEPKSPSDHILVALFQEAATASTKLQHLGNGDKLMLYGLYKQATVGDADPAATPSALNLVAQAKHQAWCKFIGMPAETAMFHYIQAVKELGDGQSIYSDADSAALSFEGPSLGLGLKPSTPIYDETAEEFDKEEPTSLESRLRKAAATCDDVVHMKDLVVLGADINAADDHGETALHFCADRGMLDGVIYLLELGANANACDHDGISVLQAAVIAGHVKVCQVLLEEGGADPDHADSDGDTPRSCALEDESEQMQALFADTADSTSPMSEADVSSIGGSAVATSVNQ